MIQPKMTMDQWDAVYSVLEEVHEERVRQHRKWGEQNHPDGTGEDFSGSARVFREICNRDAANGTLTWRAILQEEHCEALAESDPVKLRAELIQVAAVAVAWIESIDRRMKP